VEGKDWERHRRLTAPSFNENVSSLVWDEAARQAQQMLVFWSETGQKGTKETTEDTAALALHVLTNAAFGVAYAFNEGVRKPAPGHEMSYRESLNMCLGNILTFAILPKRYLYLPFLPKRLKKVGEAAKEFQQYMAEMLAKERSSRETHEGHGKVNLMNALIRASDASRGKDTKSSLTDEEIFGNVFVYNLAGHETTANTLAYALFLPAAHPEYQDWVREEITGVRKASPGQQDYDSTFPKLPRCLAAMVSNPPIPQQSS
ncbi:MAG: hypothetical protein Q9174_007504, partial [Haloplaca sp. 1 TL-2023]